jgi:hypothetical protein
MTGGFLYSALQVANFWLGSLAVLQFGYLLLLGSPAGIFYNFVRELGGARQAAALGTDADRHEGDG